MTFLPEADMVADDLICCLRVMRFKVLLLAMSRFDWLGSKLSIVFLLYSHFSFEKFLSSVIDLRAPLGVLDLSSNGLVLYSRSGEKLFGVHLAVDFIGLIVSPFLFLVGLCVPLS